MKLRHLSYIFSNAGSGRPYCRDASLRACRTKDNACVIIDGTQVVFASETERFTHVKHDFRVPILAYDAFVNYSSVSCELTDLGVSTPRQQHSHHLNHIFETFYQSGFHDAAVLVNDGWGDCDECITFAYMEEGCDPVILKKFSKANSPCHVYSEASVRIFGAEQSEGKLMGLAAYGTPDGNAYIQWDSGAEQIYTNRRLAHKNSKRLAETDAFNQKNIAHTIQQNFEETLVSVVKNFKDVLDENKITTENLCMSGGGILNCPTNSRIVDLGLFKHYYASPQPGDGCAESVGRAFRGKHLKGERLSSKRLANAYLGVTYPASELIFHKENLKQPLHELVSHLQSGGIIAWFQSGAEYGPRALGHRSFLADPTSKEMLDALNKIKGREWWRPLAPVVPEELFARVFDVENTDMCEFMLRTLKIKERWQPRLRAVSHIDGTTRPQLLRREVNPQLYDLLMAFFQETHIPCLVNTSLNINGFPIVETPREFCDLSEEISFMENIPNVMSAFVEDDDIFKVCL